MKRLIVLTLFLAAALFHGDSPLFAESLKIATLTPMTSLYSEQGIDIIHAVKLAAEDIQAEGGIPGFDRIEILSYDSACETELATENAAKIVNAGVVAVIGAYCSHATIAASEALNQEKVMMITPASTCEKITDRGMPYMFRTYVRNDEQGEVAVKFMTDHLRAKSIVLVDNQTEYSHGLANHIEALCKANGISVLAHEYVRQEKDLFPNFLKRVKSLNPDVFYVGLQGPDQIMAMFIQAKKMGIKSTLFSQDTAFTHMFAKVGEGTYLTFNTFDNTTPAYLKFYKKYSEAFGDPGVYSAYAYDSAMSLFRAILAAGNTNPERIRDKMLRISFEGVTGPVQYKPNGDLLNSNFVVFIVRNNRFAEFWNPKTGQLF